MNGREWVSRNVTGKLGIEGFEESKRDGYF